MFGEREQKESRRRDRQIDIQIEKQGNLLRFEKIFLEQRNSVHSTMNKTRYIKQLIK